MSSNTDSTDSTVQNQLRPVVVEFKTGEESEFQKPDHDPHGETSAAVAHSGYSCDNCGKYGLVPTGACEEAAGMFDPEQRERDLICRDCADE